MNKRKDKEFKVAGEIVDEDIAKIEKYIEFVRQTLEAKDMYEMAQIMDKIYTILREVQKKEGAFSKEEIKIIAHEIDDFFELIEKGGVDVYSTQEMKAIYGV